jgi:anti-sigma28 factor (negative regulator of flagellin synthesis)
VSWRPVSDGDDGKRPTAPWSQDADRRAANVDRIRTALDSGTYEVSAREVADAIVSFYARPSDSDDPEAGSV